MKQLFWFLLLFLVAPLAWAGGIDINAASLEELDTLPGIGPSKAAAIIDYRTQNGPFTAVDQLEDVPGIGPSTMASIRDLVSVGGTTGSAPPPKDPPAQSGASTPAPSTATATAPPPGGKVNVNTATEAELQGLPGIGPTKAAAIKADRDANGAFASCDDLGRVNGIGPATLTSIADVCTTK